MLNDFQLRSEHIIAILLPFLLWFIIFIVSPFSFWFMMMSAVIILNVYIIIIRGYNILPGNFKKEDIIWGIISAFLLYLIFAIGYTLFSQILPNFNDKIEQVYQLRNNYNNFYLIFILLFIIGPGEEIFWRGFLQREFQNIFQPVIGLLLTTAIYTMVHLFTGNIGLIIAAAVAGLYWGILYLWKKSLFMIIISHALWDVLILVLFPLH